MQMHWYTIILIFISTADVRASVAVGANLDGLDDWSRSVPYVNLIRQSRVWGSPSHPWDSNATFDPVSGWPTSVGILEASINNANFIQVQTPSTGNMTLFQPAPTFQFNINPTVIPSIVTLRLRNIKNGYSILSFDVVPTTVTTTTTTT